jgi:hypothetical protein
MGRDEGTLLDIARAARAILTFVQGLDRGEFSRRFQDPVRVLERQGQVMIVGLNVGPNAANVTPGEGYAARRASSFVHC